MSEALPPHTLHTAGIVYNAFPWAIEVIDGLVKDRPIGRSAIHWFFTDAGTGRGLEDLVSALPLLRNDTRSICAAIRRQVLNPGSEPAP